MPIAVNGETYDDEVQLTMKSLGIPMPEQGSSTPSRMPLESPTEPAGELKSEGGSQTPDSSLFTSTGRIKIYPSGTQLPQGSPTGEDLPNIEDVPHHDWVERLGKSLYESAKSAITAPGDAFAGRFDPMSEEGVRRATDMAGWMVGAPAPVASKLADGTLGSFAGVRSKALMKEKSGDLMTAQIMQAEGKHPDTVFNKTGWFQGADGRWKYELDDSAAKFDTDWMNKAQKVEMEHPTDPFQQVPFNPFEGDRVTTLGRVLDHPELYKAYPQLKEMPVVYQPDLEHAGAFYSPSDKALIFGKQLAGDKGTFMHEIQHAIQDFENFGKGGQPIQAGNQYWLDFTPDYNRFKEETGPELNALLKKIADKQPFTKADADRLKELRTTHAKYKDYVKAANETARDYYMRLAGEVESRNVETRLEMGPRYRRELPPQWTEDELRSKQIVSNEVPYTSAYGIYDPKKKAWIDPDTGRATPFSVTATNRAVPEGAVSASQKNPLEIRDFRKSIDSDTGKEIHHIDFRNSEGKTGQLSLSQENDGKTLSVHWVGGNLAGRDNQWRFGTADMRDLVNRLKEIYPNAEELKGYRISGARSAFPRTVSVPLKPSTDIHSGGAGIQYNMIGNLLDSIMGKTPANTSSTAPVMKQYPNEDDALNAIKQGFGYGTGLEPYINAEVARIYKGTKLPASGSLEEAQNAPSSNVDLTKFSNLDLKDKVGTVFAQAALAANRDPIAGLGFDPSKIKLQTGVGKSTIAGFYDPKDDEMWLNAFKDYREAAVHESIHRGLKLLREKSPEAKEILNKMKERNRDQEEYLVRHIMDTVMGNPEENLGESARDQVVISRRIFGEHSIHRDENAKDLARLREIAIELHKNQRERGPR